MHPFYGLRNFDHLESLQDAMTRPAIDISEQGDKYVLDADLPGVSKENIKIWVGDSGRNVTIEGKVVESSNASDSTQQPAEGGTSEGEHTPHPIIFLNADCLEVVPKSSDTQVVESASTQLSTERQFTRNMSFTRTIRLPRPVDTNDISAKMENGVLRILAKKAEDKASTSIPIQ